MATCLIRLIQNRVPLIIGRRSTLVFTVIGPTAPHRWGAKSIVDTVACIFLAKDQPLDVQTVPAHSVGHSVVSNKQAMLVGGSICVGFIFQ